MKKSVQEALKIAAQLVEATPIGGKRDTANPDAKSDGFFVRYERDGGKISVTLHVDMRFVPDSANREMALKIELSHGSEYRSPARTREFLALLTRCTELAEQIEAALGGDTFAFEVQA